MAVVRASVCVRVCASMCVCVYDRVPSIQQQIRHQQQITNRRRRFPPAATGGGLRRWPHYALRQHPTSLEAGHFFFLFVLPPNLLQLLLPLLMCMVPVCVRTRTHSQLTQSSLAASTKSEECPPWWGQREVGPG